jgi:hypothetical protein
MRRRVIPVLVTMVCALSLLGASACGGEDVAKERNTYADQVNQAQNEFARSFSNLSRRISSTTTPARGRKTLQGFEDAVDTVVLHLRRIDAPSDLAPLHRRLIGEIAGYGKAIHKAKLEFATGSPQRSEAAQGELVDATTSISKRINRTIADINRELQAKK